MAVDVGSAVGHLDLDISGFLAGLRSAQSEADRTSNNIATRFGKGLTGMGKAMTTAGTALTKTVTTPIVAAGTAAFKFSSDFESAMAQVKTIADPTAKSIGVIRDEIVDLSNDTGMAASDLAAATYQAISAGVDTASSVEFVANASKLATAGFTGTTTAVDALTTIINAYGLSAEDATHISDVLISTQNKGKTTVNELAATMGKVIPTANAMGVSLEDLGVAYSYLTAGGIATAESTTYLNGMFNELGKGGTTVSDVLKKRTGKSFQELMQDGTSLRGVLEVLEAEAQETGVGFNDLWSSQEAGKAALSLLNTTTEEYNDTLKDFQTTVGDTQTAYETMADTTEYKLNVAMQNGKNALIQLGDTLKSMLLPFIEKGVELLQQLNGWLSSLSEEEKEQIVKIAAIAAAIGPALIALGKFTSGFGGLFTTLGKIPGMFTKVGAAIGGISAPVVAVVAVIAVLVAAFANLWKTNEEFRDNIIGIWDGIKAKFEEFGQGIVDRLNALGFDFQNFTEVLKAVWDGFCGLLAPVFEGAFSIISSTLGAALDVLTGIFDVFAGLFTGNWDMMWTGIQEIFEGVWNGIKGFFSAILNTLKGLLDVVCGWFGTTWSDCWNGIKSFFVNIWNSIKTSFSNILNGIKSTVSNAINGIKTSISNGLNTAKSTVSSILESIKSKFTSIFDNAKNIVKNAINTIKGFFNFEWSLPKIKLPHFSISGRFSLNPPSIPHLSVSWYKSAMENGMIMNSPTIFGYNAATGKYLGGGEAGSETVVGTRSLLTMIKAAVADANANIVKDIEEYFESMYADFDASSERLLSVLRRLLESSRRYATAVESIVSLDDFGGDDFDYIKLSKHLADEFRKAPIQNNVNVEMRDGDVYFDNERVGRKVAPVVSRVIAQGK